MSDFITGTLEQNEVGSNYEGVIYDRYLLIRLENGQSLVIFDMKHGEELLSTSLQIGETYTFVLVPLINSLEMIPKTHFHSTIDVDDPDELWQGEIIDLHWKAPQKYRIAHLGLHKYEWIVVSTPIGNLLMDTDDVRLPISVGTILQWEPGRLDLYAVV